ncbi:MAG: hypothetical protein QXP98_09800 [Thermoproteus sp.]
MPTPMEIAISAIADGYYSTLVRLCDCVRLRREYSGDLELATVADAVMKALAEERPITAGPVRIEVKKKILGKALKAYLWDKEVDPNELLTRISQARSRAAWLQTDCSDQAILDPIYATNDRDAIEYAMRHLDDLAKICEGVTPKLEGLDIPQYVKEGIKKGIEKFLSGK